MMNGDHDTVQRAKSMIEADDAAAAVELLASWTDQNPDDASAWMALGAAHAKSGDWSDAEAAAREAVRLRPDAAQNWSNLGTALRKLHRFDDAREAQEEALRLDPDNTRATAELSKLESAPRGDDQDGEPTETPGAPHEPPGTSSQHDTNICELCGYRMGPLDAECRRCGGAPRQSARRQPASLAEPENRRPRMAAPQSTDFRAQLAAHMSALVCEEGFALLITLLVLPFIGLLGGLLSEHVWALFWLQTFAMLPWTIGLLLAALYYTGDSELRRRVGRVGLIVAWAVFAIAVLIVVRRIDVPLSQFSDAVSPFSLQQTPQRDALADAVTVEINRHWTTSTIGSGYLVLRADPGKQYLVANLTARNNGDRELTVGARDFDLEGSDRNIYSSSLAMAFSGDSRLSPLDARLLPGGKATGDVVFEVHHGAQPENVRYSPLLF